MTTKPLPIVSSDEMRALAQAMGVSMPTNDSDGWLARRIVSAHPTYKNLLKTARSDAYVQGIVEVIAEDRRREQARIDSMNRDPFEAARTRVERLDAIAPEASALLDKLRGKISPAAFAEVEAALKSTSEPPQTPSSPTSTVPVNDSADPFALARARIHVVPASSSGDPFENARARMRGE